MWKLLRPDAAAVVDDEKAQKSLSRYFAVAHNAKPAKFLITKKLAADFAEEDSLETLWKEHQKRTETFGKVEHEIDAEQTAFQNMQVPAKSYFDLKTAIAKRILQRCQFPVEGVRPDDPREPHAFPFVENPPSISIGARPFFEDWTHPPDKTFRTGSYILPGSIPGRNPDSGLSASR